MTSTRRLHGRFKPLHRRAANGHRHDIASGHQLGRISEGQCDRLLEPLPDRRLGGSFGGRIDVGDYAGAIADDDGLVGGGENGPRQPLGLLGSGGLLAFADVGESDRDTAHDTKIDRSTGERKLRSLSSTRT